MYFWKEVTKWIWEELGEGESDQISMNEILN